LKYINTLKSKTKAALLRKAGVNVLDNYVMSAPSPQNALDIFKNEWASKLPGDLSALQAGVATLFEDGRIDWIEEQVGGIKGMNVLELGPLEAGHTYMLEQFGAASIVSIEANTRAYLKCLVIKELLQLKRASFLCGDFIEYLRNNKTRFDLCVASGVLYHMRNPVELIQLASAVSNRLFLWTHYYAPEVILKNPTLAHKFPGSLPAEYADVRHTLYRYEYESALNFQIFCGGSASYSYWLSREDILICLKRFGFTELQINFDHPDHPNGPSFAVMATRRSS